MPGRAILDARDRRKKATIAWRLPALSLMRVFFLISTFAAVALTWVTAQTTVLSDRLQNSGCRIQSVEYQGWQAQQLSNSWVQLILVPQNGGRLMQVSFAGHSYLFVNRKYAGKYLPPTPGEWFNYGGDKLWLLPEGNNDEQHWAGGSDAIDDGPFAFRRVSDEEDCKVELTGPADPQSGVQLERTIWLDRDSPRIRFHASMKNISGHSVEWAMQSVSQYDTAARGASARMNPDFWTFTPANPASNYLNRYHVRFGPAENPAASVREDGLFAVHYVHLAAELWLDTTDGWLAVVDGSTQYAMIERFRYEERRSYPGKASVIFWTNGPEVKVSKDGEAALAGTNDEQAPYYLEAEINSPLCRLLSGEVCSMETEWFPTRAGKEFHGVTDGGIVARPLQAKPLPNGKVRLSGSFGVFFPGHLLAYFYDKHGSNVGTIPVMNVNPTDFVSLDAELTPSANPERVSLHVTDEKGLDRGSLQEVRVSAGETSAGETQ